MGTLTHAKGQTVTVPDDAEAYYLDKGWTHAGSKPEATPSEVPDKSWKNDDIVAYAAKHSIDLEGATKKDDLLSAIATARLLMPDPARVDDDGNPVNPAPQVDDDGNAVTPSE